MAEKLLFVCDICGAPAEERGRKPGAAVGVRKKTAARKATAGRAGYSKNGKRLGRPPTSGRKKAPTRRLKTTV